MDMKLLAKKYEGKLIAWAIVDCIQEYLENKEGSPPTITLDEIRAEIIACEFETGIPELHRILAQIDSDFVPYIFELAKGESEADGYTFNATGPGVWTISHGK